MAMGGGVINWYAKLRSGHVRAFNLIELIGGFSQADSSDLACSCCSTHGINQPACALLLPGYLVTWQHGSCLPLSVLSSANLMRYRASQNEPPDRQRHSLLRQPFPLLCEAGYKVTLEINNG